MIPGRRQQGCRGSANRERCNGYLMTAYAAVVDSTFYRVRHGFAAINNAITAQLSSVTYTVCPKKRNPGFKLLRAPR
jgi:hypothetical protein